MKIEIIDAPERAGDPEPLCLRTCGTAYRGHDPQCPVEWYERGRQEVIRRVSDLLDDI